MLSYRIGVDLDGGARHVVTADGRDLRAWERAHDASALTQPMSVSLLSELAFHAGVRAHLWPDDLDAFDAACISVEVLRAVEADPTREDPGDGSSPLSPSEPASPPMSGTPTPQPS